MGDFERKSDGRRIFTTEFKRQAVEQVRSGETTVAALSRELSVAPALIRRWIKLSESGSAAAVDAGEDVVPASRVRCRFRKFRPPSFRKLCPPEPCRVR